MMREWIPSQEFFCIIYRHEYCYCCHCFDVFVSSDKNMERNVCVVLLLQGWLALSPVKSWHFVFLSISIDDFHHMLDFLICHCLVAGEAELLAVDAFRDG